MHRGKIAWPFVILLLFSEGLPAESAHFSEESLVEELQPVDSSLEDSLEAAPGVLENAGVPQDLEKALESENLQEELARETQDLIPAILPSGESKSAVTPQAISLPSGEASMGGMGESFQPLLSSGTASMSVPIILPPGRAGLQPSLSFSYLSSRGNGILGIGWDIPVPFISRQTDKGLPRYARGSLDRFIYNGGEELVPVASPSETVDCEVDVRYEVPYYAGESGGWAAPPEIRSVEVLPAEVCGWWYFRTRMESGFMRFFLDSAQGRWVVQDKNGAFYYFGETPESRVEFEGGGKIFQWNLTRVLDAHGNIVLYQYEKDRQQSYLRHAWWNVRLLGDWRPWTDCVPAQDCYGHHVEWLYDRSREDVITSYASGYAVTTAWRLERITVESVDLQTELWRHTRDYDLSYDGSSYYSLLSSLQLWGRDRADSLPAMSFGYTEVEAKLMDGRSGIEIPGFGGFDERLWEFSISPPHSVDEGMADLFDANADGFADLLVTDPARYADGHGLFVAFCDSSWSCSYRQADDPVYLYGSLAVGGDFSLSNANLNPMDIDSDGVVEFLHMPHLRDYGFYRIEKTTGLEDLYGGYEWSYAGPFDPEYVDPDIDFTRDAAEIRLVDVDNDHMVDVVRTAGTRMEHWLNLGRCEGGEGKFGTPRFDAYGRCTGFSAEPITSCVLHRGLPKKFSDGDLRLADMNGDGLQDIVHIRRGDIAYWAGRGPGVWGDGGNCPAGMYGDDRETLMEGSYWEMDPEIHEVFLSDVNADGLSDLLQVRFDSVDIWLNAGGTGFLSRYIVSRTPAHPGFTNRLRFADVDGTGTPDILWGDAGGYRYMDLMGKTRPRVLDRIENGLGKVTVIDYAPSSKYYVQDIENGRPIGSVPPTPSFVVARVTVSDSLGWEQATEYEYHDGHYDGCEAEFRGFREAIVKSVGDANSPTSFERTVFHLGERSGDSCLDENPLEGLKGQVRVAERYDEAGVFLETDWSSYRTTKLFTGLNGLSVWYTYGNATGTMLYDTSHFIPSSGDASILKPSCHVIDGSVETPCDQQQVPLRADQHVELLNETEMDALGNVVLQLAHGRLDMDGDETATRTKSAIVGEWTHKVVETWIDGNRESGDSHERLNWLIHLYNESGDLLETREKHFINLPAQYFDPLWQTGGTERGWLLDKDGGIYSRITHQYNPSGTVRATSNGGAPDGSATAKRSRTFEYDVLFGAFLEEEAAQVDGSRSLVSRAVWDSGFVVIEGMSDYNWQWTIADYDDLNRISRIYRPGCLEPAVIYDYEMTQPLPFIKIATNETCSMKGNPAPGGDLELAIVEEGAAVPGHVIINYFDGLSRKRGMLKEGDSRLDTSEPAPWIVTEHNLFDAKGVLFGTYLSYPLDAPESFLPGGPTGYVALVRVVYDAFGRETRRYSPDGADSTITVYGLMKEDIWDAEDQRPGRHFGTYSTNMYDGQNRLVRVVTRLKKGDGTIDLVAATYKYDTQGNILSKQWGRLVSGEDSDHAPPAVIKVLRYDSLGQRIFQDDPDAGVFYYVLNEVGDLVRVQDARGIVIAYSYDLTGRLVGEDYNSDGDLDIKYGFDFPFISENPDATWYSDPSTTCHRSNEDSACASPQGPLLGRLSWVADRSGRTIWGYDERGREIFIDRQMSMFEIDEDGTGGTRIDDYSQIWHTETEYDEMNRVVRKSLPEEGANIYYKYNERSFLDSVWVEFSWLSGLTPLSLENPGIDLHRGSFLDGIFRDILGIIGKIWGMDIKDSSKSGDMLDFPDDAVSIISRIHYNPNGQKVLVEYGDSSRTVAEYVYDVKHRLSRIYSHQSEYMQPDSGVVIDRTLVNYTYIYDHVDNLVTQLDQRSSMEMSQWGLLPSPVPVDYHYSYDTMYRLTQARPVYHEPQPERVGVQDFDFDALGTMVQWKDEEHKFYEWSLGKIRNGYQLLEEGMSEVDERFPAPHAIYQAFDYDPVGLSGGYLKASYDKSGRMTSLDIFKGCGICHEATYECDAPCTVAFRYTFIWDEVGRLARASAFDGAFDDSSGSYVYDSSPKVSYASTYAYDNIRNLSLYSLDGGVTSPCDIYIGNELEVREATFDDGAGAFTGGRPTVYVPLVNDRFIKIDIHETGNPDIFYMINNHLGSNELTYEYHTGQVVSYLAQLPYGAVDLQVTSESYPDFKLDYRFTGKEEDEGLDLLYFVTRFYNYRLGRWISRDDLYFHDQDPGRNLMNDNLYAYAGASPVMLIDLYGQDINLGYETKNKINYIDAEAFQKPDSLWPFNEDIAVEQFQLFLKYHPNEQERNFFSISWEDKKVKLKMVNPAILSLFLGIKVSKEYKELYEISSDPNVDVNIIYYKKLMFTDMPLYGLCDVHHPWGNENINVWISTYTEGEGSRPVEDIAETVYHEFSSHVYSWLYYDLPMRDYIGMGMEAEAGWIDEASHPEDMYKTIPKSSKGMDLLESAKTRGEKRAIEIKLLFEKMKKEK